MRKFLIYLTILICTAVTAQAETFRLMSFNAGMSRKGPGLLVRDLMKGEDKDLAAVLAQIARLKPDILALQSVDYDHDGVAVSLIAQALGRLGHNMPFSFAARPNTGMRTGLDLDRNGWLGDARDAQGYGKYAGQGGLAILSRYPVLTDQVIDYSALLWHDVPWARLPQTPQGSFYQADALEILRLHSVAAWRVPVRLPGGVIDLLTSYASPPVFDGPEDRNGLRNADEVTFWREILDGWSPDDAPPITDRFAVLASLNNDPADGEGLKPDIRRLLSHPRLTDPQQTSPGGRNNANADHAGASEHDTVLWEMENGPGNLRVDYALPSAHFKIAGSGVDWPDAPPEGRFGARHRPVWVDIIWN